ncbi:MAG: ion transporter, partial [Bacteroidia bacterium]|nr:ion transporter [Bacteroidia bacterium]
MQQNRLEKFLKRTNTPILVLAIIAIVFYILELFRVVPKEWLYPFLWANFLIDVVFFLDLSAKCFILGRSYLKSPWFLIDFLSTLPIISSAFEVLGAAGPQLQAARVARGARVARIARITRVARLAKVGRVARLATAIRAKQGLSFLKMDDKETEKTPRFNRSLFIGVPFLLIGFIIASSLITTSKVGELENVIQQEINLAQNQADLDAIKQQYDIAKSSNALLENVMLYAELDGRQEVPISLQQAYIEADRIVGIMLLVVLLTIALSVFIS